MRPTEQFFRLTVVIALSVLCTSAGDDNNANIDARYIDGERRIKINVLRDYDSTTRPVQLQNSTVRVYLGMSLFHILETNEKSQTISMFISVRASWSDEYLKWKPDDYGGIAEIRIPATSIWRPDITINNNADHHFDSGSSTSCIVQHTGHVLWMFPAVIKTTCTLDVRFFPFDEQRCDIVFISWTYTGIEVDLAVDDKNPTANYFQEQNQEWHVKNITAVRKEKFYACCAAPYPDVTFALRMQRRSTFYVMNLVAPFALLYAVSFVSFYLPVESGDKVSVEITILLAMVVFLMVIAETLPPTPDAIPLLGAFFEVTMLMVAVALSMAVIVTNLHFRKNDSNPPPSWLSSIFLELKRRRKFRRQTTSETCVNCGMLIGSEEGGFQSDCTQESCLCSVSQPSVALSSKVTVATPAQKQIPDCNDDKDILTAKDWIQISLTLDHIFFYLYCLLSVIAFVCVFSKLLDKEDV